MDLGLRPYACIICARNYRQKKLLKAHYASVHDLEISSFEIPNIDGSISRERVGEVLQRPFKRIQPANPVKLENIPNRSVK